MVKSSLSMLSFFYINRVKFLYLIFLNANHNLSCVVGVFKSTFNNVSFFPKSALVLWCVNVHILSIYMCLKQ